MQQHEMETFMEPLRARKASIKHTVDSQLAGKAGYNISCMRGWHKLFP